MKLLVAFRVIYSLAAALFFLAAVLVTASLFIADHVPQSGKFIPISAMVSGAFIAVGLLLLGIQFRAAAIAKLDAGKRDADQNDLAHHLPVLLVYLILGGLALCLIMASVTIAMLARINQGFAIFG